MARFVRRNAAPLGVFVFFAVLYAVTSARTIQGGDAGELMLIGAQGGVVHPPGYPLMSILVQAAIRLLPVGTDAFRAALVSVGLAAACLATLCDVVRRLTASEWAGVVAASALGLSTTFWHYATVAEVLSGAALTAALLAAVAVRIAQGWRGAGALAALGLTVATGIANHHTVILLAPLALWAFGAGLSRPLTAGSVLRGAAACSSGLAAGFISYLWLMIPSAGWAWGRTTTLPGLLHHFLRGDYGTTQLAISEDVVHWWTHPTIYLQRTGLEFFIVFALVAVVGIVAAFRKAQVRGMLLATLATWAVTGPLFLALCNLKPEALKLAVVVRFHILPNTLLAVFIGLGVALVLDEVRARRARHVIAGLIAALILSGACHLRSASHAHSTVLEDYISNLLVAVEPDALVIGSSDSAFFGMLYAQVVEGRRPDIVYVQPSMLTYDWYRQWLSRQHPDFEPESLVSFVPIPELVRNSIHHRPVYIGVSHALRTTLVVNLPDIVPESAVLFRVLPPGVGAPPPAWVEGQMNEAVDGFVFRSFVETPYQWTWTLEWWAMEQYATCYLGVASAYALAGDVAGEQRCLQRAASFSPASVQRYHERDSD